MTVLFVVITSGTSENDDAAKEMLAQHNTSVSNDALGVVNICILSLLAEVFNLFLLMHCLNFFVKQPKRPQ